MIPFSSLSALPRAFFALWALLVCLVNAVLAAVKKRYLFLAASVSSFAPAYFSWQVIFDLALARRGIAAFSSVTDALCGLPWAAWLAALVVFSAAATSLSIGSIRHERNFITPGAVKTYLDGIPCGVCCWKENGRVLFANVCMDGLCAALTDGPLRNGNEFSAAVGDGIRTIDGKKWRFTRRDIVVDGEHLREMIAFDVTVEYARTQALERDKAELSRINRGLKEYTLSIDETVRRQEILQAKVNIHDEMNKLMLKTVAAEDEAGTPDDVFSLWEKNALLLCLEGEREEKKGEEEAKELAHALKIRLITDDLPSSLTVDRRSLFFAVVREAIVNAAKHARAKTVEITFSEKEEGLYCRFVNDGDVPQGQTVFSGGLANLARLAGEQGATISATSGEKFTLTLFFPRNDPKD